MISKLKSSAVKNIIGTYINSGPKNKKLYNRLLSIVIKNLRTYYTIPSLKDNYTSIDGERIEENKKELEIINECYIGKKTRDNIPSVAGYIPYLKNQTSIYFYHFFSINYGLRKTFIGQLSLLGENDEVVKCIVLKFPVRYNGVLDLGKIFKGIEGVSCILEIYNPRLSYNHAGHQGHLRYWGIYGKDTSTVHSMPLYPLIVKDPKPVLAERRFYPKIKQDNSNYFINYSLKERSFLDDLEGDLSATLKLKSGYTLQMRKSNDNHKVDYPSGVWHHSTFSRKNFIKTSKNITSQAISFPLVKDIDAVFFFGEYISSNEEIEFTLVETETSNKSETKRICVDTSKQIKASEIFDLTLLCGNIIMISPTRNTGLNMIKNGYINIQYLINDNICDGVHAHTLTPNKNSQGLKFMHYKIDKNFTSFVSIWGAKNHLINYRLRVFDSNNRFEKCFNLSIKKNKIIQQINIESLGVAEGRGIIQLECDSHNPSATTFISSKIDNLSFLSVCHMTGG